MNREGVGEERERKMNREGGGEEKERLTEKGK